jgi:hypothetical protein
MPMKSPPIRLTSSVPNGKPLELLFSHIPAPQRAKAPKEEHFGTRLLNDARREGIMGHKRPDEAGAGEQGAETGSGRRRHEDGGSSRGMQGAHSPGEIRQAFSTSFRIVASWKIG